MYAGIIAVVVLTLVATGAIAQQGAAPSNTPAARQPAPATQPPTQEAKGPWYARDFLRTAVYNMSGERIGDVTDFALDENGKLMRVVIGVGGFLGIGEKEVALTLDQAKRMVHSDGKTYFTVSTTKDQLQTAPAYSRSKM